MKMKWFLASAVIILVLGAVSILAGTASNLGVNGGTIQQFDFGATVELPSLVASVDIQPEHLQVNSEVGDVLAFIELPLSYAPGDIAIDTVRLCFDANGTGSVEQSEAIYPSGPTSYADLDGDGVTELEISFAGSQVVELTGDFANLGAVSITIYGEVGGRPFAGSDILRVID